MKKFYKKSLAVLAGLVLAAQMLIPSAGIFGSNEAYAMGPSCADVPAAATAVKGILAAQPFAQSVTLNGTNATLVIKSDVTVNASDLSAPLNSILSDTSVQAIDGFDITVGTTTFQIGSGLATIKSAIENDSTLNSILTAQEGTFNVTVGNCDPYSVTVKKFSCDDVASAATAVTLVVCFNRATRKVTDGGGLIAEVAMYEKEALGYNLKKATKAGDILYILQGRDENGMRSLRPSEKTIRLGEKTPKVFDGEDNARSLEYFKEKHLTVKEILETYCIATDVSDPSNPLGFSYGFLDKYDGYKSKE